MGCNVTGLSMGGDELGNRSGPGSERWMGLLEPGLGVVFGT